MSDHHLLVVVAIAAALGNTALVLHLAWHHLNRASEPLDDEVLRWYKDAA